jgi:hypothetical protein
MPADRQYQINRPVQLPVELDKLVQRIATIATTGIWEHPYRRSSEWLGLWPPFYLCARDGRVWRFSEKGNAARRIESNFLIQGCDAGDELGLRKIIDASGRAIDSGNESKAEFQGETIIFRSDLYRCESREMNDPPKPIASSIEMMTRGGGAQSGIDSAEQDREARCNDVR